MIIKYANKRIEKYFSDYSEMKKKIPAEWVRNIKKHIDRMKGLSSKLCKKFLLRYEREAIHKLHVEVIQGFFPVS